MTVRFDGVRAMKQAVHSFGAQTCPAVRNISRRDASAFIGDEMRAPIDADIAKHS
ncbi:hypothetical protein [Burkholderia ubonensis]|uniref:hypothetical protein n=1 Tax=Burkholderia ubonensis TaxID=101571 RepID=UPI000B0ADCC5|nr:hypothetical protein [Burkholderia ubonensis]